MLQLPAEQQLRVEQAFITSSHRCESGNVERVNFDIADLSGVASFTKSFHRGFDRRKRAVFGGCRLDNVRAEQRLFVESVKVTREVEHQDRDQHQHTSEQRVEEELDRGVFFSRATPNTDQEIHRQEHDFPKDIKQEEVECEEHTQHSGLKQQEQNAVAFHLPCDRPTGDHRQDTDSGREHDQRETNPVDTHEVVDGERFTANPRTQLNLLQASFADFKRSRKEESHDHGSEDRERRQQRSITEYVWICALGEQGQNDRCNHGNDDDNRQPHFLFLPFLRDHLVSKISIVPKPGDVNCLQD